MQDVQLPDGTWVTSLFWTGAGLPASQCVDHQWEPLGPVRHSEEPDEVPVQMETCPVCGWGRVRYLGDPHAGE